MPEPDHNSDDRLMTRRGLIVMSAAGVLTFIGAPVVLGHDDENHGDHDDDDGRGRGRGRGRGGDDDRDEDEDDLEGDVQAAGTVPVGSTEVRIVDDDPDGFRPGSVTIDADDTVTWVNLDDDPHTATGAGFDTGIMQPGDVVTLTFAVPGSYPYSCQIHPEMVGEVIVRGANGSVPSANDAASQATPGASPQATPETSAGEAAVVIDDLAFDPEVIQVRVGTTVTWTNREASAPHTVTSVDQVFGSDTLNESDSFSHTFDTAGTFDYICAIHPRMEGTVIVTD